jgi:ornithine cyclodeaminase
MEIRILTAQEVRSALPMAEAIDAVKEAYRQFSSGQATVPLRTRLEVPRYGGMALFMPASLGSGEMGVKIVSVYPGNVERELPTIHALVVVLDSASGRPLALLEGGSLTALRTGAASGAATDILARADSRSVAIFGSGAQARTQLEAICTVRAIERVWIYSLDVPGAEAMVREMRGRAPVPKALSIVQSPSDAIKDADIVCTATVSSTPVFEGRQLRPGTHVNAIGSYTPEMQEIDAETVLRSLVVVDSREAVLAETGDLLVPIRRGLITPHWIHAELGEIIAGREPGRTSPGQVTVFKSVGLAVQDALAAGRALARAETQGLGQVIQL